MYFRLSAYDTVNVLTTVYRMFANDKDYPISARQSIAEHVCLAMLKECGQQSLMEFFSSHICEIMETIEAKLVKVYIVNTK